MVLKIGAHVSISGSVDKAVDREEEIEGNTGQIFTHSPRMWKPPSIDDGEAEEFREKGEERDVGPWLSHASYLINMGSAKEDLWDKSVKTMKDELKAADKLGLVGTCVHPGTAGDQDEMTALDNVVDALDELKGVSAGALVLLENMAGSGTQLCWSFEQISYLMEETELKEIGMVLDTCHAWAAGYDLGSEEGLEEMIEKLDSEVGLEKVEFIHLNDSKHPLGSEKDRHEHIGEGEIGEEAMERILTHPDLSNKPFILETPVDDERDHADNIRVVRALAGE